MRTFWLMDQHGGDGPTALVQTDGSMRIVDVLRFGPGLTELEDQQRIWDQVMGRVAPTLKPFVDASTVAEEGIEPLPDLVRGDGDTPRPWGRPAANPRQSSTGRASAGPQHRGSRGDR